MMGRGSWCHKRRRRWSSCRIWRRCTRCRGWRRLRRWRRQRRWRRWSENSNAEVFLGISTVFLRSCCCWSSQIQFWYWTNQTAKSPQVWQGRPFPGKLLRKLSSGAVKDISDWIRVHTTLKAMDIACIFHWDQVSQSFVECVGGNWICARWVKCFTAHSIACSSPLTFDQPNPDQHQNVAYERYWAWLPFF